MTRAQDKIALDASTTAQLVKSTAEQTATALNIQYIQKDITEIKDGIKSLQATQDGKIDSLENKIDFLSKMVYMGLGGVSVLSFVLRFFIK